MRKALDSLAYPFTHLVWCVVLLVLSFGAKTICLYVEQGQYVFVAYLVAGYVAMAYLVVLLTGWSRWTRRLLLCPVMYCALLWNAVEIFLYMKFHNYLTGETLGIMMDTNGSEAREFFMSYVPWWLPLVVVLVPACIVCLVMWLCSHTVCQGRTYRIVALAFAIFCLVAFLRNPAPLNYSDNIMSTYVFKPSEHVDMTKHLTHPVLDETSTTHPATIVVILGESFARGHSSLYGYEKQTNPELQRLSDGGNLFVFKNVTSPALVTKESFKYILNTHRKDEAETDKQWYDYTTLIEILNVAGYRTVWCSNQEKEGVTADNLPAGHGALCDVEIFNDKSQTKYDEWLLNQRVRGESKMVVFYHLMGQHPNYRERYPEKWEHFHADDYTAYPSKQRDGRAAYDNACLYNDYVVSRLIKKYEDEDAVVIYLSDHGMDIYESDDDLSGHANVNVPKSAEIGKEIPFAIYLSDRFKASHPEIVSRIKASQENAFCTDCLTFVVMDLLGYAFHDNDDVVRYSALQDEMR